jgi:hypothetical protein
MALIMNLAALPVKFVAVPILAGLAAGTGAVAAYVTGPAAAVSSSASSSSSSSAGTLVAALPSTSTAPAASTATATPAKPEAKPSCEQQTWPYLDNRCIARGNDAGRKVRLVVAPRAGEAAPPAATGNLVTSDTVLRGPGVAPELSDQPAVKKPAKRSETRRQRNREAANRDGFNRVYSVYSVPSGESTKPVIVVRPLRLGSDSSRF